jgi:IS5 family transposase
MSDWLDRQGGILSWVAGDLRRGEVKATGRCGLRVEAVVRCAILKQYFQLSYKHLAFHLSDSVSFRAFARLCLGFSPKTSVLQRTISAISEQSWERINHRLLSVARAAKVETGTMVRIDSTTSQTPIHAPTDSSLLWDGVRVMVRLLKAAGDLPGAPRLAWCNHSRRAKKRARRIDYCSRRGKRAALSRDLIAVSRATLGYLQDAAARLVAAKAVGIAFELWQAQVSHYLPLIERIIDRTERRVVGGETVPARDKLVSLFEPHSDIIVKGERDAQYGHKLNLASPKSGMILDVVIEAGNPGDAERCVAMLERRIAVYSTAPRQAAFDGGYASRRNLKAAKALGVKDVAFHKKRGLKVDDMLKSNWV